jgi:hypothetical protein
MYQIQLGQEHKAYRTMLITDNALQAERVYGGYNVHSGGRKRLLRDGRIVARVITDRHGRESWYSD